MCGFFEYFKQDYYTKNVFSEKSQETNFNPWILEIRGCYMYLSRELPQIVKFQC